MEAIDELTILVGDDPSTIGNNDGSCFFTTEQLQYLLDKNNQSVLMSARDGWSWKSAKYSALCDVAELGATRSLRQLYTNSVGQVNLFQNLISQNAAVVSAGGRVAARAASITGAGTELVVWAPSPDDLADRMPTILDAELGVLAETDVDL